MSNTLFAGLAARLDLKPDELKRALGLGLMLGGVIGSYTLAKTVRDAHFLSELPVSVLPWVYIGVGVLSAFASGLLARVTRRAATWESLAVMSLLAAISLAAFGQLFRIQASWVPVTFYLWSNVYGLIVVSQFWLFANSVSNPREARRTFSFVGLGGILGGLVGGLIAAPLAHVWSLTSLLNAAAVLQALVVLLVRVGRSKAAQLETEEPAPEEPVKNPVVHPYVRWLALAALCSVMVTGVLDYQFKAQMQRHFTRAEEYVSFLGMFYTLTNLAAFGLQALGTRWMIQRLGASWSSLLLPAGLGVTTTLTLLIPSFATVAAARLWDQVTRLSVSQSVGELFYFPLDPALRRRAKSFIGSGLERLGDGFSGALILVAGFTLGATSWNLALLLAVLLLIWIFAWLRIRRGYVAELGVNLRRMNLGPQNSRVSLREAGILREMEHLLESRYERVVIQGIELLEENAPERIEARLDQLLDHSSGQVRARALHYVRIHRLDRFSAKVDQLIHDQDPEAQVQALSAHCAFSATDLFGPLVEYLESGNPRVRIAAILCLVEQAPPESEARLRDILENLLASGDSSIRCAVAEGLGRRPGPSELHEMLGRLLADPDLATRRAALRSAGKAGRRTHIPILIDAMGTRITEDAARTALVSLGDRVVGTLGDYLNDSTVPLDVRHAIPRALAEIPTQDSVNALFRCRDASDNRLAYRVLKASNRLRVSGARVTFPRALVTEDIERDVGSYLFALIHVRAVPGHGTIADRLLATALRERIDQAMNRVFRRLALIYSAQNMAAAYQGITSSHPRSKANAVEYLENALAVEHRALILPLMEERAESERIRLAETRYAIRPGGYEHTLEQILTSDDAWLRACALFVAGSRKERSLLPLVESNLSTLNALVRETASWARLAIATGS
ncbi:MAG TPA: Npt1/Npt2 family nucleotide transporter [Candidatus Eisenbacteria bacterium]|nr:Npt1/Npt2 family nucleotide transporter [Candidatus Eisenbacteria bacterium]